MTERRPGEGRYARIEREQRWVASQLPADARLTADVTDRYISGTRLRLRRTTAPSADVFKLGQKIRRDAPDPEVVKLTNMYLSREEYDVLASLPAAELRKTRWHSTWRKRTIAIDRFHGRLEGLLLAEVELDPDDVRLTRPAFALRDVTSDDRFSGGALAIASDATIRQLLREVGSWPPPEERSTP